MAMAIEEGRKGAGFVSPNPLVGCVILDRNFDLLSCGYHAKVGQAHAEINALNQIEDQTKLNGAHVYVTLEPCAHEGRTGSCAKALAALPIASVTYGLEDPNPLVSGKGVEILRQAGKTVAKFEGLTGPLEELAEIFLLNMRHKRPFVAVKVAASLDGQVALADGSSRWITGESSRAHVHYLRGCYDALLTGAGTIIKDNPLLNSRDERFVDKPQRLIILDPDGVVDFKNSRLIEVRSGKEIVWVTGPSVSTVVKDIVHLKVPLQDGVFVISELLSHLWKLGIYSVFVEAGPTTNSHFLTARVVDRVYCFLAPKILGRGLNWTSGLEVPNLSRALELESIRVQTFDRDILITGRLPSS